jgi:3-oxoacyl-[acyl-carrier protein] reductase
MTLDHFSSMIKINLAMPALLIQALNSKLNPGCSVIFFSSISQKKGSYDPAYAASKAGIKGLLHSLANACPSIRFNSLVLGLVEDSPVHQQMSPDFVKRHSGRMFNQKLINKSNVSRMINELLINESINRSEISLDGGFV